MLVETVKAVRNSVPADYPIFMKINSEDYLENGLTREDSLKATHMAMEVGLDGVELSGGTFNSGRKGPSRARIRIEEDEAYFLESAKLFKKNINIPIILVGGIRSFPVAERLVIDNIADYISMSRPFVREPGLVNRWESGDLTKSACKSDLACFRPAFSGDGLYCVTEEKEKIAENKTQE